MGDSLLTRQFSENNYNLLRVLVDLLFRSNNILTLRIAIHDIGKIILQSIPQLN